MKIIKKAGGGWELFFKNADGESVDILQHLGYYLQHQRWESGLLSYSDKQ